jgi:hypothetical protein
VARARSQPTEDSGGSQTGGAQPKPDSNGWVREIPFDQATFLDKPEVEAISKDDKAAMAAVRKREQALAQQGVKVLTPTFPELFGKDKADKETAKPKPKAKQDDQEGGDGSQAE